MSSSFPILDFALQSNGFALEQTPERLGTLLSSDSSERLDTLRTRFQTHGYLWLKSFLPPREVRAFRRHFFSAFAETGLLAPNTDPLEGIYSGAGENAAQVAKRLMECVRSAAYEAFCLHPRLWSFLEGFLEGPAYLHKRKIIRYTKPHDAAATGAHYDLIYLRGGTDRVVTVWIPIGDIAVRMGGLVYLEGSHLKGQAMEAEFRLQNASLPPEERISAYNRNMTEGGWISKHLSEVAQKVGGRWLVADYEAGDVMLHSPYMVHAATTNQDPDGRIRLSTDIRYQNVRDEIDARWASHWSLEDML